MNMPTPEQTGMHLEARFIQFLIHLFTAKGYTVTGQSIRGGPDVTLKSGQDLFAVELKIHRSTQMAMRALPSMFGQMGRFLDQMAGATGILIVTQPLDLSHVALPKNVVVWDLPELGRQTAGHFGLARELLELVNALQVGADTAAPFVFKFGSALAAVAGSPEKPGAGQEIVDRLTKLKPGKEEASKFEDACQAALELMFGTEFFGWRRQNEVDEGFHRMDLIARLVPTENPFWTTLASDFRTRYVVFEFKNYTNPISQDQIYTTEKYLFTAALRSVAIVIAREGASESARKAIRGALREQGKLILCISRDELVTMLLNLDGGGDPTDLLYEQLDQLLMTIAR